MSRPQHEFNLPLHPQLLEEINETSIAIKAWYFNLGVDSEAIKKLRENHKQPSWQDVEELLMKCWGAINEQRDNPRKY